jgi:hypothetical protein
LIADDETDFLASRPKVLTRRTMKATVADLAAKPPAGGKP